MSGMQRGAVRLPAAFARLALGAAFLSAVAARFGLWDDRLEPFAGFVAYTGEVLSFMPRSTIPFFAVVSTIAETALGALLVVGVGLRRTAFASAVLLGLFGVSMTLSFGIKAPLDGSVFSASAAALLLAVDEAPLQERQERNAKTTQLVVYRPGPGWIVGKPVTEQPLEQHGRYMLSLYVRGALKLAGPFLDDAGGAVVLEAENEVEAKAMVSLDPAVVSQVFVAEVHPWRLVDWERYARGK